METENKNFDVKNISVAFGENCVFRDFSLTLPVGKITCILGPSGSGKTTLLKVLGGILPAENFQAPRCSFIFQEHRLLPHLTALDNLAIVLHLSLAVLGRNSRCLVRITHSHGEDRDSAPLRNLRVRKRLAAQVAAVGDEDDRVVVVGRRVEGVKRRADGAAEISLAARGGVGGHILHRFPEECVVGR